MDFEIDTGWKLLPVGGDTGQAYMGIKAEEKLFLKRNSSPFLAALSVEGITPRLVWTKRIGNGDVLTAQEWLNGRTLKSSEMALPSVAKLLYKIHHSDTLRKMLSRVGGEEVSPEKLIQSYQMELPHDLKIHPMLNEILAKLKAEIKSMESVQPRVCHGDIYRKNWLLSDENRLYLVDWDMAVLADPALDLSMLLCQYVEKKQWRAWLENYGVVVTDELIKRIEWYALINFLQQTKRHHYQSRFHEMNQDILTLQSIYKNTNETYN